MELFRQTAERLGATVLVSAYAMYDYEENSPFSAVLRQPCHKVIAVDEDTLDPDHSAAITILKNNGGNLGTTTIPVCFCGTI